MTSDYAPAHGESTHSRSASSQLTRATCKIIATTEAIVCMRLLWLIGAATPQRALRLFRKQPCQLASGKHGSKKRGWLPRSRKESGQCRAGTVSGKPPTKTEHRSTGEESSIDKRSDRQVMFGVQNRRRMSGPAIADGGDSDSATHHENETGIPPVHEVQKTEHFFGICHAGDGKADTKDDANHETSERTR